MSQPDNALPKYYDIGSSMEDIINDIRGATALLVAIAEQTDPEYSFAREWQSNGVGQIVARIEALCNQAVNLAYNGPKAETSEGVA